MKKTLTILAATAASVLALSAGAASAQGWNSNTQRPSADARYDRGGEWRDSRGGWMNINQRQAQLDRRIDQGIRNGSITRNEAIRLRSEFRDIARLENRYRANGLSNWERADLDRRFDGLSARIRWERNDGDRYGAGYGYGYGYGRR